VRGLAVRERAVQVGGVRRSDQADEAGGRRYHGQLGDLVDDASVPLMQMNAPSAVPVRPVQKTGR